jgi:hypothetical protein
MSHIFLPTATEPATDDPAWLRVVVERARALRYGSIQIKVHDSQVVLVESTEQTRFDLERRTRNAGSTPVKTL